MLPLPAARGVYGGNTIAQTILVGIESSPANYVPMSFHSYFIAPGRNDIPMEYLVTTISNQEIVKLRIKAVQGHKIKFTALMSLRPKETSSFITIEKPPESLHFKYPDPDKLHTLVHTEYVKNAYSDEFVDYSLVPQEASQSPSDRWINVWSCIDGLYQDEKYKYVALGGLSDAFFLTTLARILHAPWNPTQLSAEVDPDKDARAWMDISLNALHIFHYNAMSLDHHIYFHDDDYDAIDWLTFNYQARRISNNRTLVRGYFYNRSGKKVATVAQEGLTLGFKGFKI